MAQQSHRRPGCRIWHVPALLLPALWLAAAAVAADDGGKAAPVAPLEKGTLSGAVVDAGGKPVAGARVRLVDQGVVRRPVLAEALTGTDGRFRLGPMEPFGRNVRYHLIVDADDSRDSRDSRDSSGGSGGLAPATVARFTYCVFAGADNDVGTIRLLPGRVFSGRVLGADGKAVAGAEIEYLVTGPRGSEAGIPSRTVRTDAGGRFRTPPLPAGFLEIGARADGYVDGNWGRRTVRVGGEESLEPLRLEPDVPLAGVVVDEQGRPVEGATVAPGVGAWFTTDPAGRFLVRGLGRAFQTDLKYWKHGYRHTTRDLRRDEAGLWLADPAPRRSTGTAPSPAASGASSDASSGGPVYRRVEQLRLVLPAFSRIGGRAVDEETGEPVRLERVVLCACERQPDGQLTLSGCTSDGFEQPEPGRFTVPYGDPDWEFHVTLIAPGYHDAEAFVPKQPRLSAFDVGVVRMRRKKDGTAPTVARQQIAGAMTRDGRPVKAGWVILWHPGAPSTASYPYQMHGRLIPSRWPGVRADAVIRDGRYVLEVPYQLREWYVVAEEPGQAPTVVGPVEVALNEQKVLDVACTAGGAIRGHVSGIPPEWAGRAWIVAFDHSGLRAEAPVDSAGRFRLTKLPPGEWGLKVGHDLYDDADAVERGKVADGERDKPADGLDAWKRAKVVRVEAGREAEGVELELPTSVHP